MKSFLPWEAWMCCERTRKMTQTHTNTHTHTQEALVGNETCRSPTEPLSHLKVVLIALSRSQSLTLSVSSHTHTHPPSPLLSGHWFWGHVVVVTTASGRATLPNMGPPPANQNSPPPNAPWGETKWKCFWMCREAMLCKRCFIDFMLNCDFFQSTTLIESWSDTRTFRFRSRSRWTKSHCNDINYYKSSLIT